MVALVIPQGCGEAVRMVRTVRRRHAVVEAPSPAVRRARVSPSVYRRRRLAALVVLAGIVAASALAVRALGGVPLNAAGSSTAPSRPGVVALDVEPVAEVGYVVQRGDTVWSIARRLQPAGDVRPLVDRLAASLGGRPLQEGERITLPVLVGR